jgi:mono/diheme cytochrome c family protein
MMKLKRRIQIGVGAVALIFLSVLHVPVRADAGAESMYKAKCISCHAPDGSGDTAVGKKLGTHDFRSSDVQNSSDEGLGGIIAKGKNKMPAYEKSLKPDEIKGLVTYIRSFAAKK